MSMLGTRPLNVPEGESRYAHELVSRMHPEWYKEKIESQQSESSKSSTTETVAKESTAGASSPFRTIIDEEERKRRRATGDLTPQNTGKKRLLGG